MPPTPALFDAVVTDFDPIVGLGTIETADGQQLAFHATAIADGTRSVGLGALVTIEVAAAPGGRFEASSVALRAMSFPCPVCRTAVPGRVREYEICPRCDWEDDPVQFDDPVASSGANGFSLDEARARWLLRD